MDYFNLFFDENLVSTNVDQTNLYYDPTGEVSSEASKTSSWFDVTIDEMYVFLATTMLMAFTKKNKLLHYWSTDRLIMTPIFNELFPRHRYTPYYDFYTSIIIQNNQNMICSIK
jgi:hypothetical protein